MRRLQTITVLGLNTRKFSQRKDEGVKTATGFAERETEDCERSTYWWRQR